MKLNTALAAFTFAASLAGVPSVGQAGEGASYALQLEGHVPVICRVSVERTLLAATSGAADLGAMTEFCNSSGGYQVWLEHAGVESGAVTVDGEKIALSPAGSTLISQSATAGKRTRQVTVEGGGDGALSLRIVPL
jgi:hypothetical protein